MRDYRWDKRRAQKATRNPKFQFDIFDFVFLVLLFAFGGVLIRLFYIYAVTTSSCADLAANFGAGPSSPPAFKQMFTISLLLFVFWITLMVFRPKRPRTIANFAYSGTMLLGILMIGYSAYHMSIWDKPNVPDGTLAVTDGVWTIESGHRVWKPQPFLLMPFLDNNDQPFYEARPRAQKCVWLNDGLISVGNDPFVKNYSIYMEKLNLDLELSRGHRRTQYYEANWHPVTFAEFFQIGTRRKSHIQTLRNYQEHVRPLTNEERERFMEKRRCIKRAYRAGSPLAEKPHVKIVEHCDPEWYPAWP